MAGLVAGKPGIGMKHRKFRHHKAEIKQAAAIFGEEAVEAARRHIISDLHEEGWVEDVHPEDETDYVKIGSF